MEAEGFTTYVRENRKYSRYPLLPMMESLQSKSVSKNKNYCERIANNGF